MKDEQKKQENNEEVKLVGIDVHVDFEFCEEQRFAVITCAVDPNLLVESKNYEEFEKSNAYEALMDALDKFVDDPGKGVWMGESTNDPDITAALERDYEAKVEDSEIAFYAKIYGDLWKND